ncbi:SDR family oxidoreductase [Williamsia herbipolensis]|uniref:SDR family oxidoreductase n=1 Tax=Williamsia herbipolensis TaxID=1603258 RepID=UPI0005F7B12A|nr:SDR family oxidoreductase [Williamsia herbipolensis]
MPKQKTILVTGASRGVGAETARMLAARGHHVVINYREKRKRAENLVDEIIAAGGSAVAIAADLTVTSQVAAMIDEIARAAGQLDAIVLNASGGLERGADPTYPLAINRDAQLRVLDAARELMKSGSRVVYVTSHQAHFIGSRAAPDGYLPVATSKRAGEDAVRQRHTELATRGIGLSVVSGDMIEGTMIVKLLHRRNSEAVDQRRGLGPLPTIVEFSAAVCDEIEQGGTVARTVFVGGSDYLAS